MPIALSNDGLYGATITGAWLKEDGTAVGLNVTADEVFDRDGNALHVPPVTGTAYLNFYDKSGKPKQREIDTALKILVDLDSNTWDNFEAVVQSLVGNRARVYLEKKGNFINVRAEPKTSGPAKQTDATGAKRNLAMLTRGMATPAPVQQTAPANPSRQKLQEILTKMNAEGKDWQAARGPKKILDMTDAEVDAALAKIANGPDLTPPDDDIPF